jgi:hypothetical protein
MAPVHLSVFWLTRRIKEGRNAWVRGAFRV